MGFGDERGKIDDSYAKAAKQLSAEIYKDIEFPSGEVESHEQDRRDMTPKAPLVLRHLANSVLLI